MLERGVVERISRGVCRLADLPPIGNPDLVTVGARVPKGVVCLISALAYHELTTEVPQAAQRHRAWIKMSCTASSACSPVAEQGDIVVALRETPVVSAQPSLRHRVTRCTRWA
jgi:hypothetical protein